MSLRVNEITDPLRLPDIKEDWDRILETSGEDSVFLRTEWISAWWKAFGKGREMILIEVTDGSEVVGYAPLMISKVGKLPPWNVVEFIASDVSDRSAIISEYGRDDVHKCVWKYIFELRSWDGIDIRNMQYGSPTARNALSELHDCNITREVSPYIPIAQSYDEFFKNLTHKDRHNLRRCWRRLQENHACTFGVTRDTDTIRDYIDNFVALERARWDTKKETNVIEIPGMVGFLKTAFEALSENGWASIHFLEERGEPFAIGLAFDYAKRYSCYLSAFDPRYAKYSPGTLLLDSVIKMCHERRLAEIDLLRGGEAYKYRFGAIDRYLIGIRKHRTKSIKSVLKSFREKLF